MNPTVPTFEKLKESLRFMDKGGSAHFLFDLEGNTFSRLDNDGFVPYTVSSTYEEDGSCVFCVESDKKSLPQVDDLI